MLALLLAFLALYRVERTGAEMQGRTPGPSEILRLEWGSDEPHLHLLGWVIPLDPVKAPARVQRAVSRFWDEVRGRAPSESSY